MHTHTHTLKKIKNEFQKGAVEADSETSSAVRYSAVLELWLFVNQVRRRRMQSVLACRTCTKYIMMWDPMAFYGRKYPGYCYSNKTRKRDEENKAKACLFFN